MSQTTSPTQPNILLITCHDLGRHLGCYGIPSVRTPSLDSLAATGVRLDRAFAVSSGCSPSRAAAATGRYPHANGVMGLTHPPFGWDLLPNERHIAEILGDAGYETHLFGFQHVSPHDERAGFHHLHTDQDRGLAGPVASRVANLFQQLPNDPPFYIEINLEEPHRPYDQGGTLPDDERGVTIPGYLPRGPESVIEMAALQGAVHQADSAIGKILAGLDETGLAPNTLVVFMTDHGLAMPRAKCTLYDPGIEIALLLRRPLGGIAGGRVVDDLISNVDLLPTVLEAVDLPIPKSIQGKSFLSQLRGQRGTLGASPRTAIFAEKTYHSYYDPMRAVRTEHFKYIRNFEPTFRVEVPGDVAQGAIFRAHVEFYLGGQHVPVELYDLWSDPLEQVNLAGTSEHQSVQDELDARLTAWMEETGDPLAKGWVTSPGFQREMTW